MAKKDDLGDAKNFNDALETITTALSSPDLNGKNRNDLINTLKAVLDKFGNSKFNASVENLRTALANLGLKIIDNIKPLDCGVYASFSWLESYVDWRALGVAVWNAQWGHRDFLQGYMWQYTDKGVIGGKLFDMNLLYDEQDKAR